MTNKTSISISYHQNLKPLERLLSEVRRPGDYFVHGTLEMPMPRVEVQGVGVLSFPLPDDQARKIIQHAERAPYGRGEATILDPTVRKVWQVTPEKVRIDGKSWEQNFGNILSRVTEGLGCAKSVVAAELYKLLLYDKGSFFVAHRDTEKAPGMFATLVVVLPSAHRGGELVVRHGGGDVTLDLSAGEHSELTFAAFYADCEHEVRPISQGNRLCLIYNLIQKSEAKAVRGKGKQPLVAPIYDQEMARAAKMLEKGLSDEGAPVKLAWLLEHKYSPAELSFDKLKNADAALVKVLSRAAIQAGCAVHLAIVHIGDSGAAQEDYNYDYRPRRSRSRWVRYDDDDEEQMDEGDEESSQDFEIVDICDSWQYVDEWVDFQNRKVDFGRVPLGDGELLPQGALDYEKPDDQSCSEATGNEGASYERSYHRAALVIWRQDRYAEVLLQAGVAAVMPYLQELVRATTGAASNMRSEAWALAGRVIDAWRPVPSYHFFGTEAKSPSRSQMLDLLCELNESPLIERFIKEVEIREYDGSENASLAKTIRRLDPTRAGELFAELVTAHTQMHPHECVDLLARLRKIKGVSIAALQEIATALVGKWADIGRPSSSAEDLGWQQQDRSKPIDPALIVDLLELLGSLESVKLRETAAATISSKPSTFDPVKIVVPALSALRQRPGANVNPDAAFQGLWHGAAGFLLQRSEVPPEPPRDWRQEANLSCACEHCRELQSFARDPFRQVHRFRVRKDRRQHLHGIIERHELDMTHVTDRHGSPQTLVCTKTRRMFERRCKEYHQDVSAMKALRLLIDEDVRETHPVAAKLTVAITKAKG